MARRSRARALLEQLRRHRAQTDEVRAERTDYDAARDGYGADRSAHNAAILRTDHGGTRAWADDSVSTAVVRFSCAERIDAAARARHVSARRWSMDCRSDLCVVGESPWRLHHWFGCARDLHCRGGNW